MNNSTAFVSLLRQTGLELRSFSKYWLPYLGVCLICLGLVYQVSYWSSFDIDVTQYMGFKDVLQFSSLQLFFDGIGTGASAAVIWGVVIYASSELLTTKYPKLAAWILPVALVIVTAALCYSPSTSAARWLFESTCVCAPMFLVLYASSNRRSLSTHLRATLAWAFFFAAFSAWDLGETLADQVFTGASYNEAFLPDSALASIPNRHETIYYLGHIDEYAFFWNDQKTVVLRSLGSFSYQPGGSRVVDAKRRRLREFFRHAAGASSQGNTQP
jgi:hypothetical protein